MLNALTLQDLSDEVKGDNQSKDRAERELQRLHETIALKEEELERIKPQYEEMKRREEECTRELVVFQSSFLDHQLVLIGLLTLFCLLLLTGWA